MKNLSEVEKQAQHFFALYRQRPHSRLGEQTPRAVHRKPTRLPKGLQPALRKHPLYEGQVHFMRKVLEGNIISILNVSWSVSKANPDQGVWATLDIKKSGAKLIIFDAAPDVSNRKLLDVHPFKLSEPVLTRPSRFSKSSPSTFSDTLRFAARIFSHLLSGTMS